MKPGVYFLLFAGLMTLFACKPLKETKDSKAGKPNIIFIYADDLGRGLLGVNG